MALPFLDNCGSSLLCCFASSNCCSLPEMFLFCPLCSLGSSKVGVPICFSALTLLIPCFLHSNLPHWKGLWKIAWPPESFFWSTVPFLHCCCKNCVRKSDVSNDTFTCMLACLPVVRKQFSKKLSLWLCSIYKYWRHLMLVLSCLTYKINNNLEIYPCFINILREIIEHFLLYFKKDFFFCSDCWKLRFMLVFWEISCHLEKNTHILLK